VTNDKANEGVFNITLTGTITNSYFSNPAVSNTFVITMRNICNVESTTLTGYSQLNSFDYIAGDPTFSHKFNTTFGDN
jgi:hypothetical protein